MEGRKIEQRSLLKKLSVPRLRLLWVLIAAVWIFVILKMIAGALFEKNTTLVSAFSVTDPVMVEATVEVTARYPEHYLDSFDKKLMMKQMANAIRLTMTSEPEMIVTEQRQEMTYYKEAKAADTELRIISLQTDSVAERENDAEENMETGMETEYKHYLYAKIALKDSIESVLTYKELLEETMLSLHGTDISTTVQLKGEYVGFLTMERRNEITDDILEALNAKAVYEYREEDLYTVYAYTAALENYITVENKKINVHIAISRDEENYRTIVYLASPILPDTW